MRTNDRTNLGLGQHKLGAHAWFVTTTALLSLALAGALLAPAAAAAQTADVVTGPYVGIAGGWSGFGTTDIASPRVETDHGSFGGRLTAGYRFTQNVGLELGYANLGSLEDSFRVGNAIVHQKATGQSLYAAVTGRLPITQQFALNGKLGYASNKVSGTNVLPPSDSMIGSQRGGMLGIGAEYAIGNGLGLTADLDVYGKLSDKVKGSLLSFGLRQSF